ncbi:MAG TPA: hypothetical protein VG165_05835 [Solirubrobacteraceae bacterium]|jgi:hypothetical protein|nr:hypothetical protein [Solirubrobacteraceae bacterium]
MSRRSRTITTKGTLGVAAAIAGLFAFAAPSLADSSVLSTSHPDLVGASVAGSKAILACFDKPLATNYNINNTDFYLQGYAETRRTGITGQSDLSIQGVAAAGTGNQCVTVTFSGTGDVRTYSDVTVLEGTVTSTPAAGAQVNVQGSVPLVGSLFPNTPGSTLRPQLVSAATASATTAVYNFSEPLSGDVGANGKFGFYSYNAGDTTFHSGTISTFTQGATAVAITFTGADATALSAATRFVVREGAVTDSLGQGNPLGTTGNASLRINLTPTTGAVSGAGGTIAYHFDFDQAIPQTAVVCPADFALFDTSGVRYSPANGIAPSISADRRSVTLDFVAGTAGGDPDQITLATVAADGIDAANCNPVAPAVPQPLNSDGSASLSGATDHAGLTSGPDLINFTIDKSNGNVLFDFDAPVATTAGSIDPADFALVDGGGGLTSTPSQGGCGILDPSTGPQFSVNPSTPNEVVVNFGVPSCLAGLLAGSPSLSAVDNAVGVTVNEGAVADAATGDVNPIGTLGVNPPAPTTPVGPTTPPAPPVPTVPPLVIPPVVKKPSTGCVTKRIITIHLLTSISARIKSATATVDGKAYPVSKKLVITIPLSKYEKVKTVTLKIKGKPKTGHLAINATRTYHPCGG